LVCAEVHSTALDISTRGRHVSVIFGDGSGAVCLEAVEAEESIGVLASALHAQGELANVLMMELPSHKMSPFLSKEMMTEGRHYPVMDGRLVFKTAVKRLSHVTKEVLKKANLSLDDIDLFIPHQANLRINEAFANLMNVSPEKVFNNIQQYGNTTAASIPIALDEALEKNRIGKGSTVVFLALGAGLTWGAVIYRFAE
jgi:3-oxoacyl-[acyl-carrier-protein] synthase-3